MISYLGCSDCLDCIVEFCTLALSVSERECVLFVCLCVCVCLFLSVCLSACLPACLSESFRNLAANEPLCGMRTASKSSISSAYTQKPPNRARLTRVVVRLMDEAHNLVRSQTQQLGLKTLNAKSLTLNPEP